MSNRKLKYFGISFVYAGFLLFCLLSCDFFLPVKDDIDPTVKITFPAEGDTVSGVVEIKAEAHDDTELFKVVFKVDGALLSDDYDKPYTASWNSAQYAEGTHNLLAIAYDTSGNFTNSEIIKVTSDNSGGSTGIVFQENFDTYSTGEVGLTGQLLNDPWLASGLGTSMLSIEDDPALSGRQKVMRVQDEDGVGNSALLHTVFTGVGEGSFEFDIYLNSTTYVAFSYGLLESGKDYASSIFFGIEEDNSNNNVLTYSDSSGTYLSGMFFNTETWYTIKGLFDCSEGVYAILIDGTILLDGIDIPGVASDIINALMFTCYDTTGMFGDFYIDNIIVTAEEVNPGQGNGGEEDGPAAPSDLSAAVTGSTSVELNWTDNSSDEEGFYLYRFQDAVSFSDLEVIADLSTNITTYNDTGLSAGETYYYTLTAYNSDGTSSNADPVSALMLVKPQNVSASDGVSADTIDITWDTVPGAVYYAVYRSTSEDGTYTLLGYVDSDYNSTYNTLTSPAEYPITPGITYWYRIAAADEAGYKGALSDADSGWAAESLTPENFTLSYTYYYYKSSNPPYTFEYTLTMGFDLSGNPFCTIEDSNGYTANYTVTVSDVESLYSVCTDNNLFRSSWTPYSGMSPTGVIENRTFTVVADENEYTDIDLQTGDPGETADLEAILSALKSCAPIDSPDNIAGYWDDSTTSIQLSWDAVAGCGKYTVYAALEGSTDFSEIKIASGYSTSITTYPAGGNVQLYVTALDEEGNESPASETVTILPVSTIDFTEASDSGYDWYRFYTNDSQNYNYSFWETEPGGNAFNTLPQNSYVMFRVKKESGYSEEGYGIIFRYIDNNNFLFVLINTNGYYYLGERLEGNYNTLKGWTYSSYLLTGYGAINRIAIWHQPTSGQSRYYVSFNSQTATSGDYIYYNFLDGSYPTGCIWNIGDSNNENFPSVPVDIYFRQSAPDIQP